MSKTVLKPESTIRQPTDRKQALFGVTGKGEYALVVGEKGLVRFSNDGGISWRPPTDAEFPSTFTFMRDVGFEREHRRGFIVGQEGMVLRSENGGKSWTRVLGGAPAA